MYKGSIDIASINKCMKVKFNLVIKDDETLKLKSGNYSKTINTFSYMGSDYLKLSPKPYVTIDISKTASDKNENNDTVWNSNSIVNLNKISLFDFLINIKQTIAEFKTLPDLFFIQNERLFINKELANKKIKRINTGSKTIIVRHAVVFDENGLEYEGITFFINEPANYCNLTYKELEYLYHELSKINMHELSMLLINAYLSLNLDKKQTYEAIEFDKTIQEQKEKEVQENILPKLQKPNEIPDTI